MCKIWSEKKYFFPLISDVQPVFRKQKQMVTNTVNVINLLNLYKYWLKNSNKFTNLIKYCTYLFNFYIIWSRFTKQGKLARERNSKTAPMGVEFF